MKPFFNGNEFYLMVYQVFKDVRLVGAPPSSIGKFGGDTDNWMWPRHTGDFGILRIYTGPDGKPAAYSKDNIPYKPKHSLPISIKGVENNDYSMIWGFPGNTDRYLTSWGVKQAIEISNPATIKIRDKKLAIIKEDMNTSDALRLKYSSKYAQSANYWKYFIGQTRGLKRLNVIEKKQKLEIWLFTKIAVSPPCQLNLAEKKNTRLQFRDLSILNQFYFVKKAAQILNTLFLKIKMY